MGSPASLLTTPLFHRCACTFCCAVGGLVVGWRLRVLVSCVCQGTTIRRKLPRIIIMYAIRINNDICIYFLIMNHLIYILLTTSYTEYM